MSPRRHRVIVRGRVPGVPIPSTAKSRAASRVNPWRHGRYAKAVTSDEVYERRFSEIEAGKIGSDQDREQIRRLQRELEHCERCDRHYLETEEVRAELRDLVMALGKTKT